MTLSLLSLAWRSLMNRKGSALLTILAVALSVALFLGVDKARKGAKESFDSTISGTHLIVGAPTGKINLLLYSVFRIGDATKEVSWGTYKDIENRSDVDWVIPVSLGDSHRGYRVLGTNDMYWQHYKYAKGKPLTFRQGQAPDDLFAAAIGAEVARDLGYELGAPLILTHGLGQGGISDHENRPFRVTGILAPTGTPVDRTVHVSLEAITAIHVGWETGARNPLADTITEETIRGFNLTPKTVTAMFVGLKNNGRSLLRTRRDINTNRDEPLMAISPAEALGDLWKITGIAEKALIAVSIFVIIVGLVSILTSILTSLNERRREMSILRAVGARPGHIFALLVLEAGVIGLIGALLGVAVIHAGLAIAGPLLASTYGINLIGTGPGMTDIYTVLAVTIAALLMGAVPAWTAFRRSLADGLSVKV